MSTPRAGDIIHADDLPPAAVEILALLRQAKDIAKANGYPIVSGFLHPSLKNNQLTGCQRVGAGEVQAMQIIALQILNGMGGLIEMEAGGRA